MQRVTPATVMATTVAALLSAMATASCGGGDGSRKTEPTPDAGDGAGGGSPGAGGRGTGGSSPGAGGSDPGAGGAPSSGGSASGGADGGDSGADAGLPDGASDAGETADAATDGSTPVDAATDAGRDAASDAPVEELVGPLYPGSGRYWNDWIQNDGTSPSTATGLACSSDLALTGPDLCLHAGEIRAFALPQLASCAGLAISDELDAFDWTCDASTGMPRAVSTGLKPGKYLSDLIDWTGAVPAWKTNRVTVTGGAAVVTSGASVWWDNPIVVDNDGGNLGTVHDIYVVTEDTAANYLYTNDSIGLVVRPGVTLSGTGTGGSVASTNSRYFLWFEGTLSATGKQHGLLLANTRYSVVRRAAASGANASSAPSGISITGSYSVFVDDITTSNNNGLGLSVAGGDQRIRNVIAENNADSGIWIRGMGINPRGMTLIGADVLGCGVLVGGTGSATRTARLENVSIDGAPLTIRTVYSSRFLNVTVKNYAGGPAINNDGGASRGNVFHRITVTNSGRSDGPALTSSWDSTWVQVAQDSSPNSGMIVGDRGVILKAFVLSNNPGVGMNTGTATLASGINRVSGTPRPPPGTQPNEGIRLLGPVHLHNVATTSDNGRGIEVSVVAHNSILTGLLRLDSASECWVASQVTNPPFDSSCNVIAGTGSILFGASDGGLLGAPTFHLSATDTLLREVATLPGGNDVITQRLDASSTSTCSVIAGAAWSGSICSHTFLRDAFEQFDDGIGNDNGLCESDETCIFMPNIGVYQGHGDLVPAGSLGAGGVIENVTFLRYETNGY